MKKIKVCGAIRASLAGGILASSLMLGHAQSGVVFNSLLSEPSGYAAVDNNIGLYEATAQGFTTGAANESLLSVTLSMIAYNGGGNFQLAIYDATGAGGTPGGNVGFLTGNTNPATAGEYTYTPSSPLLLNADTSYFVVAEDAGGPASDTEAEGYGWGYGTVSAGTATGQAADTGAGWSLLGGSDVFGAEITATPEPTPEPGTLSLAGLGLAGLLAARRRK